MDEWTSGLIMEYTKRHNLNRGNMKLQVLTGIGPSHYDFIQLLSTIEPTNSLPYQSIGPITLVHPSP